MPWLHKLELKIPPLIVAILFLFILWGAHNIGPVSFLTMKFRTVIAMTLLLSGITICALGVYGFRKSATTVNPLTPEQASALVTSGIYTKTRNPMYVGFYLFLLAFAVFLGSIQSVLFSFLFISYMNQFQIKPEERILNSIFGNEYDKYKTKVRRWI